MAGKESAGVLVSFRVGELGVNRGVLDVSVSEPVFHKGKIGAGVQEVSGDRVLECVKFPLACGDPRGFGIVSQVLSRTL
jgi:hypothetical protein